MKKVILVVVSLVSIVGSVFGQDGPLPKTEAEPKKEIVDLENLPYQQFVGGMVENWRLKYHLAGVWCAYIKGGKTVAFLATGYKDVGNQLPASIDDHIAIGSISKVVTGSMIAAIVAQKRISYETRIRDLFPEFIGKYPDSPLLDASLAQLLSHTSGITKDLKCSDYNLRGPVFRMTSLEMGLRDPRTIAPGTQYAYCGFAGLDIAAAMVERASGIPFEEWYLGEIGNSVGLTDPHQINASPTDVVPYFIEGGILKLAPNFQIKSRAFASGFSFSLTLADLCRFADFTLTNSANLPQHIYEGLFTRTSEQLRSDTFGSWHMASTGFAFHDGGVTGQFCSLRVDPRTGNAFIWGTNSEQKNTATIGSNPEINREIMRLFLS